MQNSANLYDHQNTGILSQKNDANSTTINNGLKIVAGIGLITLTTLGTGFTNNTYLHEENTGIYQQQKTAPSLSIDKFINTDSIQVSLEKIKQTMGLNISELAAILQVTRPTIYKWIESDDIRLNEKHQKRLNNISDIYDIFIQKRMIRLGSFLHKPIGTKKQSLFSLLKADEIDKYTIEKHLELISQMQLSKRKKIEENERIMEKYGFEPITKEDMDDRINDVMFLD